MRTPYRLSPQIFHTAGDKNLGVGKAGYEATFVCVCVHCRFRLCSVACILAANLSTHTDTVVCVPSEMIEYCVCVHASLCVCSLLPTMYYLGCAHVCNQLHTHCSWNEERRNCYLL